MTRGTVCLGVLLGVMPMLAAAQPPPPPPPPPGLASVEGPTPVGTATISGVVTDGVTKAPVSGVLVSVTVISATGGPGPVRPRQMTDAKGRFFFVQLPGGTYTLTASAPGYLDGGYRRSPGVTTPGRITLAEGQWFSDSDFSLWKPASLSGAVVDERGEALVGIPVRLLQAVTIGGRSQWATGAVVFTDDRGMYRFGGLHAGTYVVHVPSVQISLPSGESSMLAAQARPTSLGAPAGAASSQPLRVLRGQDGPGIGTGLFATPPLDDRGTVYPSVYHPAAPSITTAEPTVLAYGDARTDVNLSMALVPSVTVSGTVAGPATAVAGIPVRLVAVGNESLGLGSEAALTKTDADGRFSFAQVPSGDYTIMVSRSISSYRSSGLASGDVMRGAANPFINRVSNSQVPGVSGVSINTVATAGDEVTGEIKVSVGNRAVTGLVVPTAASVTVSGHFLWNEAEALPPQIPLTPSVRLEPADGDISRGTHFGGLGRLPEPRPARLDFTIPNVKPGRYTLGDIIAGDGYRFVGAEHRGRDLLETPLEVTGAEPVTGVVIKMSTDRNVVRGTVQAAGGVSPADTIVIVFPQSVTQAGGTVASGLRFRTAPVSSIGTYEFANLIPGEYLIAAVPASERGRSSDVAFLVALSGQATRITLTAAGNLTQDLRVIERPR